MSIDQQFLVAPGEMSALIRAYDWSATPLGPPESWPQGLKTTLRLVLTTRHPMFVFWGEQHTSFYNDAYRASIGPEKHPAILGMPGREAWPEIWPIIGPQIEMVLRGEGATWHENQLVPIIRHGELQEVYWTYSYGPIDDPTAPTGVGGVLVVCTETTEQVLAEQRRVIEVERLRSFFAQAPGFMCVLRGPEHTFELANAAYQTLVGIRELVGKRVRDAIPEAEGQGFLDLLDRVYTSGEPFAGHDQSILLQRSPDEPPEERVLDFVYQPITDDAGNVSGIFVEGIDVTERKRAEAERQTILDALAHDLKTPLTALKTHAQLLARTIARRGVPDAETLSQRAALFVGLADRMADLVGDLGDHARLAMGQEVDLEREPVDLVGLVAEAIEDVRQAGGSHELRFAHEVEQLVGMWDLHLLRRLVANLIGNAVKYSPEGGVVVVRIAAEGGDAVLTVQDTGIGIPAADLPHIFELRRRGVNVGGISGTGIGLASVHRIVERHGGAIDVESVEGRGTTFTVRLPVGM